MKRPKIIALLAIFAGSFFSAAAQEHQIPLNETNYSRPKRLADVPEKFPLQMTELSKLLQLPLGAKVKALISKNFLLTGTIISKSDPADKAVQSVVVKSTNRLGMTFTFTRLTEEDGSFTYSGRMLDRNAGDALEIAKEGQGYVMRKKGVHEIISE